MATERDRDQGQHTLKLYTAEGVAPRTLRQLLGDSHLKWVFAESLSDTILAYTGDFLRDGNDESLLQWEHGRAFDEALELDWWCTGQTFRLRLLTEGDILDGVDWNEPDSVVQPVQDEPYPLRLHGKYDKKHTASPERPTWSEARIPQHIAYPVEVGEGEKPPERVVLRALDYAHAGCVVLTRLLGVARGDGTANVVHQERNSQ